MKQVTVRWLDAMDSHNDEGVIEMCREIEANAVEFSDTGVLQVSTTDSQIYDTLIPTERVVKVVYEEVEGEE